MLFIIQGTEKAMNSGLLAAEIEKMMESNIDADFYNHIVCRLHEMENIGQLEGFMVEGKIIIVIKVG